MRVILLCAALLIGCSKTIEVRGDASQWADLKTFPYDDWAAVLAAHVDGNGRVDYAALSKSRTQLDQFVAMLGAVGPKSRPSLFPTKAHRLAYWINAYNACTMHLVLEHWPLESVGDIKTEFFYWTEYVVDGEERSLYAIENDVVRKEFAEPRIHFALNCASAGCPRLPAEPFLPNTLESQLARETKRFLNEERNVQMNDGTLTLSKIFEWYEDDFMPTAKAWIATRRADLNIQSNTALEFRDYDWALNRQG
jgi:hypothetical protein